MNEEWLQKNGFSADSDAVEAHEVNAVDKDMHQDGPYVVHGVWKKGLVTLLFEQNTAAEDMGGGMSAVIQHPSVCVVSGPNGKAACNPSDTDLILHLAELVS